MFRTHSEPEQMYYDPLAHFQDELLRNETFIEIPVDMNTFLYSKKYMSLPQLSPIQEKFLYAMDDINPETNKYTEAILEWGKGSGKDFITSVFFMRMIYKLLCFVDPYKYYNRPPTDFIDMLNVASNAKQAKRVFFKYFKIHLKRTNFLNKFGFNFKKDSKDDFVEFPNEITMYSGHSDQEGLEGFNLFCAVVDEYSAFDLNEDGTRKKRVAVDMYDMLADTIFSRYDKVGKMVAISFPRYKDDPIELKIQEAKENEDHMYWSFGATWEIHPLKTREMFDIKFRKNPEKAKCKYACLPPFMIDAFYKYPERIDDCFAIANIMNPYDSLGRFNKNFIGNPLFNYFAHIDLSKNRDKTGFVMGHVHEYNGYGQPIVHYDLIKHYIAPPGGEVDYEEIRQHIYALKRRSFNISQVSLDGYQSVDFMQILEKKGIPTALFSLDRDTKGHDTQKNLIYDGRARFYKSETTDFFIKELKKLQLIKGTKVDHPKVGSKDLADAGAGMAYHTCLDIPNEVGVAGI